MHSSIIAEVYNSISYVYSRISYGNIPSEVGEITAIGGFFAAKLDTSGRGLISGAYLRGGTGGHVPPTFLGGGDTITNVPPTF